MQKHIKQICFVKVYKHLLVLFVLMDSLCKNCSLKKCLMLLYKYKLKDKLKNKLFHWRLNMVTFAFCIIVSWDSLLSVTVKHQVLGFFTCHAEAGWISHVVCFYF